MKKLLGAAYHLREQRADLGAARLVRGAHQASDIRTALQVVVRRKRIILYCVIVLPQLAEAIPFPKPNVIAHFDSVVPHQNPVAMIQAANLWPIGGLNIRKYNQESRPKRLSASAGSLDVSQDTTQNRAQKHDEEVVHKGKSSRTALLFVVGVFIGVMFSVWRRELRAKRAESLIQELNRADKKQQHSVRT